MMNEGKSESKESKLRAYVGELCQVTIGAGDKPLYNKGKVLSVDSGFLKIDDYRTGPQDWNVEHILGIRPLLAHEIAQGEEEQKKRLLQKEVRT